MGDEVLDFIHSLFDGDFICQPSMLPKRRYATAGDPEAVLYEATYGLILSDRLTEHYMYNIRQYGNRPIVSLKCKKYFPITDHILFYENNAELDRNKTIAKYRAIFVHDVGARQWGGGGQS